MVTVVTILQQTSSNVINITWVIPASLLVKIPNVANLTCWKKTCSPLMQPRRGIAQYHHRAPFIANVHLKDCSNITQFNIRPLPTADDHDKHAGDCYEQTQAWHTLNSSLISKQCTLLRDLLIKWIYNAKRTPTNRERSTALTSLPQVPETLVIVEGRL